MVIDYKQVAAGIAEEVEKNNQITPKQTKMLKKLNQWYQNQAGVVK